MDWTSVIIKYSSYFLKPVSKFLSSVSRKKKYSPERTKENIEVFIINQQGSVEIWCDKFQSKFNINLQFRNDNVFPIEIDRVEVSCYTYNGASFEAHDVFGQRIESHKNNNIFLKGKIDPANLELINKYLEDDTLRLEVKAVIVNQYHNIRDFRCYKEHVMCKYYNKQKQN